MIPLHLMHVHATMCIRMCLSAPWGLVTSTRKRHGDGILWYIQSHGRADLELPDDPAIPTYIELPDGSAIPTYIEL